ncbi:hypothetical protein, unknown function [Leishmania braziliensis MHOM/BR/75/M2904]|uniref:Uncharacterized protein n=1 Tax=Leishmania braziliensis TaxID=5660 RepID=A4HLU6_LEIBR|nr:hypothetical protein, unknown function [Leishmania braziliensis MHOM/BR/75/M2904]CAM40792.2 hypothetical protein, unknown function [Leishmania braziliensis MHOM/BR/75/M2904]
MVPEDTGEADGDEHDEGPKSLKAEGPSTLSSWEAQGCCQRRQAAVIASPASVGDSIDATLPSILEAIHDSKGFSVSPPTTSAAAPADLHVPVVPLRARELEEPIFSPMSQSLLTSAVTSLRDDRLQGSDSLLRSAGHVPLSTVKCASSLASGNEALATRSASSGAYGTVSTVSLNVPAEFLQLQPTERVDASLLAQHEEVRMENEELRRQLEALVRIQEELERRYQQREEAAARVERRYTSEKKVLALEKEQALAQLGDTHSEELQALRNAEAAARSKADALAKEVVTLRSRLSRLQEELQTPMEKRLKCHRHSDEAIAAQAKAEAECITFRAAAADAPTERAAEVSAQLMELRKKLWVTEERAAAAELAFQSLCSQLTIAADTTVAATGVGVQATPTLVRDVTADTELAHYVPTSGFFSGSPQAAPTPAAFEETAVLTAVLSAMESDSAGVAFSSPLKSSSQGDGKGEAELSQSGSNSTLEVKPPLSQHRLTAAALQSSSDVCVALKQARLSNAGLLRCRRYRQLLQVSMARVSDGYQRVAREVTATADARAAKVENALSCEVKELRARLEHSQQLLLSHERGRENEESCTHAREDAGCQTTQSSLQGRASVGVVTDTVDVFSINGCRAAATASCRAAAAAAETVTYEEVLTEVQRQLHHERSYIGQLQKEVQSLRASNYAASVLESLTNAVQEMRVTVHRLVRDAVADVELIVSQERPQFQATAMNDGSYTSERVWSDDPRHLFLGRWNSMSDDGKHHLSNTSPARRANSGHRATTALPSSSSLLDIDFVRAVHKSILRAEAHIQQVSTTLLCDYQRVIPDARTFVGSCEDCQYMTYEIGDPRHSQQMQFSSKGTGCNSLRATGGVFREVPSRRLLEGDGSFYGGGKPPPSQSGPFSMTTRKRTAQQQRVYAEMRDLLQRSTPAHGSMTAFTTSPSCYSPGGSRWLSGVRPPRTGSSDMSVSPSSQPSPYIAAYATESAEFHQAASSCLPPNSAARPVRPSADAWLGFAHVVDATQALRNLGCLLDNFRDEAETREARRRQSLQEWQDAILAAVDGVWVRIEDALKHLRRPGAVGGDVLRDTVDREKDAHSVSPMKATSLAIRTDSVDHELERTQQRPGVQLLPSHVLESPVVSHHVPSRLAEVLSGKTHSKVSGSAVLYA